MCLYRAARKMDEPLLRGRSVLLVEDEMLNMMMFEAMLADLGCQAVTVSATIEDALARVADQAFDVAMPDLNLGGLKSYPVADALAARGVPFFFSTGYGDKDIEAAYRERPVLNKPFQAAQLVELLRNTLPSNVA
jgi:CheY-like chemotaxis protein